MQGRSSSWFEISSSGWRRMNAGRALGHLVREAISNVFDLTSAHHCWVNVEAGHVRVKDDGPGIKNVELITTVFNTDKDDTATMRGRKGRGLKELLAAAEHSKVTTGSMVVMFHADGSRDISTVLPVSGTEVEAWNKEWSQDQVDECIFYLERFMAPEDISFILNGHRRQGTKVNDRIVAKLMTQVVRDGRQVDVPRETTIFTRNKRDDDKVGMLYEMGIPVCPLDTPFHVDVQQRIPLNDNRDVVSDEYKQRLYSILLDATIKDLSKHALTEQWVLDGIRYLSPLAEQQYTEKMIGTRKQYVLKSDSKNANDRAKQEGLEVVDISHLPWNARNLIERHLSNAKAVVEEIERLTKPKDMDALRTKYPTMVALYEWAAQELTGTPHKITFMERERSYTGRYKMATYHSPTRTIKFNALYHDFNFDKPLQPKTVGVFLHEVAHFKTDEHEEEFRNALEEYSGLFSMLMWHKRDEAERLLGGGAKAAAAASPGKMVPIQCTWPGCGKVRMVKPQDVFQVKYCVDHQRENQRARAREARQARRSNGGQE